MINKRIVFMGTPDFAKPTLELLIPNFSVVGVVTQPDKPAGRGKNLKAPPVKEVAIKHEIETIQPNKLSDPGVFAKLSSWEPDAIVVVAFGQILRKNILDLPEFGCINVHGSMLPRWRGAAPIQTSILKGDQETGITIMKMDAGVDTGPILKQESVEILNTDTSESLSEKLSIFGAELLGEVLTDYFTGKVTPIPQPEMGATYAPRIQKEDGYLDFSKTAVELDCQVRAFFPWPGCYTVVNNDRIKVISVSILEDLGLNYGQRRIINGYPVVGTKDGSLQLNHVQPAGKKVMDGRVFINGYRGWEN